MVKVKRMGKPKKSDSKIKAFFDLTIDDKGTVIKSYRVIEGNNGPAVLAPAVKGENGWWPLFIPSKELHEEIKNVVLKAYKNLGSDIIDNKEETTLAQEADAALNSGAEKFLGAARKIFKTGVQAFDALGYRFAQQNVSPDKKGDWADFARKGHTVTWVIQGEGDFKGVVIDGKYGKVDKVRLR